MNEGIGSFFQFVIAIALTILSCYFDTSMWVRAGIFVLCYFVAGWFMSLLGSKARGFRR